MSSRPTLTPQQLSDIGEEMDALRARIQADLGQRDADYIRGVIALQRRLELAGRGLLMLGILPPAFVAGTISLALAKILDNLEIGHNVMHGQYDWMGDPEINSRTFDWDNTCPGDEWRVGHNAKHHVYTNVVDKDRDVGYGLLRMSEEQPWRPIRLGNPLFAVLLAALFQYAVMVHDLEFEEILQRKKRLRDVKPQLKAIGTKLTSQTLKDYVMWPVLSGPSAPFAFLGAGIANLTRNVWAFSIIFCGHFPDGVAQYTEEEIEGETRGEWYVRQLLGSANVRGSQLFHLLGGNLGFQIEHHLFPDIPSYRYTEIAGEVREICDRHGLPYNTGSLSKQLGTVARRICRLALPTRRTHDEQVPAMVVALDDARGTQELRRRGVVLTRQDGLEPVVAMAEAG